MQFIATALLALGAVAAAAPSTDAASQKPYYLKTSVRPGQTGKSQYNNLYLTAAHSAAGENDAILIDNTEHAVQGFLQRANTSAAGKPVYNQVFTIGDYPYSLIAIPYADFYAAWQPTAINIGNDTDTNEFGYYLNGTGLQYSTSIDTSPKNNGQFDGWLVCDWFRSAPQLFFLAADDDFNATIPCSCAKVNLVPEYIPSYSS